MAKSKTSRGKQRKENPLKKPKLNDGSRHFNKEQAVEPQTTPMVDEEMNDQVPSPTGVGSPDQRSDRDMSTLKKKNASRGTNPVTQESEDEDFDDADDADADEENVNDDDDIDGSDDDGGGDGDHGDVNDDGDDDDDDDDETAMETMALSDLPKHTIVQARNDVPAIEKKLTEIALFNNEAASNPLPFWESLSVQLPLKSPLSKKLALDDLEREKRFAELTAAAVHNGLDRLREQNVKFRRPSDFFAEMAKSDQQMGKVKAQILFSKERIEAAEKRRNNRDISKNKKKVRKEQIEKEQDKKRKTRQEIEAYSRLRQQRLKERAQGDEANNDDEFPIDLLDIEQLDDDNKFQKQKDIASGKKNAWRPEKQSPAGRKDRRETEGPEEDGKHRRNTRSGNNDQKASGRDVRKGGVKKKRSGPKKRLGKSRRVVTKSKA